MRVLIVLVCVTVGWVLGLLMGVALVLLIHRTRQLKKERHKAVGYAKFMRTWVDMDFRKTAEQSREEFRYGLRYDR